jgi:hypothetical protein
MIGITKTPWSLEITKTPIGECAQIGPFPGKTGPAFATLVIGEADDERRAELLANARLMKEAQALYRALKAVVPATWFDEGRAALCRDDARAVLARIEGSAT